MRETGDPTTKQVYSVFGRVKEKKSERKRERETENQEQSAGRIARGLPLRSRTTSQRPRAPWSFSLILPAYSSDPNPILTRVDPSDAP